MTTIYNIRATHPEVPNDITLLVFSEEERDKKAMQLATQIAIDLDFTDMAAVPDNQWKTFLRGLQIFQIAREKGNTPQVTAANYADELDISKDAGFDIWVEEHDLAIPSNIPGRLPEKVTVWHAAADDENGTRSSVWATEKQAIDWLLDSAGSDDEEFSQWQEDNPDGPDEFHDNDIFGFLSVKTDALSTYNLDETELWTADLLGTLPIPDVVVIFEGGLVQNVFSLGTLPIPDIAVILEGGLVQNVCSRDGQPVRLTVVDYDNEGADPDELTAIPQDGGQVADGYLSQGGYCHDTSADEAFWNAIVGEPITKPEFRTVWVSVIVDETPDPRVSVFRTMADRRADLIDFYAENADDDDADDDDPKGDDSASEAEIARMIESQIAGVHSVKLIRTAMAEG